MGISDPSPGSAPSASSGAYPGAPAHATKGPAVARALADDAGSVWAFRALLAIALFCVARLGVNALALSPLHFDEAQYWSYGEALDWGYYSKPPLVAWMIRASTDVFGDTIFGVRFFAPLIHGFIAWMLFATGRRLFDARTGFWASVAYLTLPAVAVSSGLMTTDPPMMAGWAVALYGLVRALEADGAAGRTGAPFAGAGWWILLGLAIGVGLLGKYTMVAFVGSAIGYALFSRQGRPGLRPTRPLGPILAVIAGVIAFSPNLAWNAANDFAAFAHVGDNASLGGGPQFNLDKAAEFFGTQILIFGPALFLGLVWMALRGGRREEWRNEWSYRLLMWLALPLPVLMTVQAFLSRAHPNWAAPAYIAATLAVVAWLLDRERRAWILANIGFGAVAQVGLVALAAVYAAGHVELPRTPDPYKKMRPHLQICESALAARAEGGRAEKLFSDDRRLLAECLFLGGLGLDDIRIWSSGPRPGNHYQLTSSLTLADRDRSLILAVRGDRARAASLTNAFESVEILEAGAFRTHADRVENYVVARVSGFKGY